MKTREQIKDGLNKCTCPVPHSCWECPYYQRPDNFPQCSIDLCKDTLEMINEIEEDRNTLLDRIIRYIKAEINPYGKPFEGTAYEFGKMLMDYLERIKTVEVYMQDGVH